MGLKTVCNCGVLSMLCSSYRYLERSEIEGERGREKGGELKEERCGGEREKRRGRKRRRGEEGDREEEGGEDDGVGGEGLESVWTACLFVT